MAVCVHQILPTFSNAGFNPAIARCTEMSNGVWCRCNNTITRHQRAPREQKQTVANSKMRMRAVRVDALPSVSRPEQSVVSAALSAGQ